MYTKVLLIFFGSIENDMFTLKEMLDVYVKILGQPLRLITKF